ncbi:restriction endonuclease subunit S [Bacillus wiedmannii]|uniref:restriction endonuclease subunit S n=1 Tax=Bacillus wiedmannii TaxID=1890302 RepID=UPI002E1C4848|nr:restriction endonuclease subunit S [Bacillus wiedmannii]
MSKKQKTIGELLEEARIPEEEQLYEIPENWTWVNLKNCLDNIQYGYTETSSLQEIGPKFLRITDIQNDSVNWGSVPYCKITEKELQKYRLEDNDIVVARTGATTGKSYLINKPPMAVFASYLIRLRCKNIMIPEYLWGFMKSPMYWKQITVVKKGSAQPGANAQILGNLSVPLPPLEEQRRIVEKVERLLNKVEEAQQLIEEAKETFELRRVAILDKMFRGELTRKWKQDNNCGDKAGILLKKIQKSNEDDYLEKIKLAKVNGQSKPKKLDRSVIDDPHPNINIPSTWEWVQLADIVDDLTDYHANGSYKILKEHVELLDEPNYACMIRATNFEQNNFSSVMKYITKSAYDFLAKSKLYGGEILISKIGNTGSVYLMPNLNKPCSLAMNLFALRVSKYVDNEFVYYYLKSPMGSANIDKYVRGVTTTSIDKKSVRSVWVPLPPINEQLEIKRLLKKFLSIEKDEQEMLKVAMNNLDSIKQSILSKAFRGELGTNDPSEENAIELLKEILQEQVK